MDSDEKQPFNETASEEIYNMDSDEKKEELNDISKLQDDEKMSNNNDLPESKVKSKRPLNDPTDPTPLNYSLSKIRPKKTFMSNITDIKDKIQESADVAIGKLIAYKGVYDSTELFEKREQIEKTLYNYITNNNIEYDKESINTYISDNRNILLLIQELISINELLKGNDITKINEITGKQEDELPTNINSYILILASIMIEKNVDLTYGLTNVTDEELNDYFNQHKLEKKKKKQPTGGRKSKRKRRKNSIKYTRKNHAKYTRKNRKNKKYKTKKK
jgi:hypothetical protein